MNPLRLSSRFYLLLFLIHPTTNPHLKPESEIMRSRTAEIIGSALLLILPLAVGNQGVSPDYAWNISVIDQTRFDFFMWPSLALDSKGYPRVSYCEWNQIVKYARWDGDLWDIQAIENGKEFAWTSLAIDGMDFPHITYGVGGFPYALRYARWTENGWVLQTVGENENLGHWTSIALDSNGRPWVSSSSYLNGGGDLKYIRWTGERWEIETVESEDVVYYNSLAIDARGRPHISYSSRPKEDLRKSYLKYAFRDGSSWKTQLLDSEDNNVGSQNSITLDARGHPHISYQNYLKDHLKYARWDGSSWRIEVVDRAGGGYSSIALDEKDFSHMSYSDGVNLRYAYWDGDWVIEVVDSGGSYGTSLALDPEGLAHIVYSDGKELKYAKRVPPEEKRAIPPSARGYGLIVPIVGAGACIGAYFLRRGRRK